jgi:hypothetical protein
MRLNSWSVVVASFVVPAVAGCSDETRANGQSGGGGGATANAHAQTDGAVSVKPGGDSGVGETGGTGGATSPPDPVCESMQCRNGHVTFGVGCPGPYVACDPTISDGVQCVPHGPCPTIGDAPFDAGTCAADTTTDPLNCGGCGAACAPAVLVQGQSAPGTFLVADATNLYWTSFASDVVVKMPLGGGDPVTLTSGSGLLASRGLAVDGGYVYWPADSRRTSTSSMLKVPVAGGDVVTLASGPESASSNIIVVGGNIYWTAVDGASSLLRLPVGGGRPVAIATGIESYILATDGTSIYYTTSERTDRGLGAVMKIPLGGGTPVTVASGRAVADGPLAVDATSVYWMSLLDDMRGVVMKAPLAGGTPVTLATGLASPSHLTLDATDVYLTDLGPRAGPIYSGTVKKVPLAGGPVTTLAAMQGNPGPILADEAHVYWMNEFFEGKVMRLDKDPCRNGVCR